MNSRILERDKVIQFNTEWYVEKIIDIFSASIRSDEKTVCAVNIGEFSDAMMIEVAYSEEQIAQKQFFHESGLNEMEEGDVKEIVRKINQDEPPLFYREKIQEYFKENLNEDFEVNEFLIIMKK